MEGSNLLGSSVGQWHNALDIFFHILTYTYSTFSSNIIYLPQFFAPHSTKYREKKSSVFLWKIKLYGFLYHPVLQHIIFFLSCPHLKKTFCTISETILRGIGLPGLSLIDLLLFSNALARPRCLDY